MQLPDWLVFFQRTFPSANMVLVKTSRPVLVDTGFGGDLAATPQLLRDSGIQPDNLALVANTHYHSDHVGGNYGLQSRYGLPIAASRYEGEMVNRRDVETGKADWLDQPIEPYMVNTLLDEGDHIDAGEVRWKCWQPPAIPSDISPFMSLTAGY
ncbi:MAG: MBL fold metallo-hydrolase [Anaerolineaceae bacterium]|nr:MBL fold metallo-hydrolase [Anaerolineaceae bacterium]